MKDFVIMTDASCDLPIELVERYGIVVVPMTITVDDITYKHYHDYRELSKENFYSALRNGEHGTTAASNLMDIQDAMAEIAENGKDILYLSLSSGLSCSYQNAILAADMMMEEYPDTVVHIIDTRSVCVGLGLLLVLAARAKENGATLEETIVISNDNIAKIKHYFTVNDLGALKRSGRISHLTASVGSLLNIKPMLGIGEDGKVQSTGKVRGRKLAIKQLIDSAVTNVEDPSVFFVCHAEALADVETIQTALKAKFPECEVLVGDIGPIIGIHTGIETIAVICT